VLSPGDDFAGYRIDRILGSGGMGVVYEAFQVSLNRTVALKVLAPQLSGDPVFQQRMRREGRLQGRLDHPHIVPVYDLGETEYGLYLAMRLIRGPTLKQIIVARELEPGRVLRILSPIADAIDTAHAAGLIHRDIKPQNILVERADHAYLADFGLTQAPGESSLTASGGFVGTYDYVSPEQIAGDRATALSDVYSFAGVIYEALTGVVPYPKQSRAAVLYAHVASPPPTVSEHCPELPAALDEIVARGMAKDPAERHPTATELMREVEDAFAEGSPAIAKPPRPSRDRATSLVATVAGDTHEEVLVAERQRTSPLPTVAVAASRRSRLRAAEAAAALVAVAAGAILGAGGSPGDSPRLAAAAAGPVAVRYPPTLKPVPRRRAAAGLALRDPISLQGGAGAGVAVGLEDTTSPSLLPTGLRSTTPGAHAQRVALGRLEALRYDFPDRGGAGAVRRLYAVPVTGGAAVVACLTRASSHALLGDCDHVAASLVLRGLQTFPAGPDPRFGAALSAVLADVAKVRTAAARALRDRAGVTTLARTARRLSAAYSAAGARLRRARVPPQAAAVTLALVSALGRTSKSYARLAATAGRRDRAAYRRAQTASAAAEAAVAHRVQALATLGYVTG
jgi:serine/threonine-protein kinase